MRPIVSRISRLLRRKDVGRKVADRTKSFTIQTPSDKDLYLLPKGVRDRIASARENISKARDWQLKHHLGFGNLLNAGFWGYTVGSDLANGESIGGTAGSALGFMGGDALANRLIKPGKGFVRGAGRLVGGLAAGLGGSMLGQHLGNTYAPIGRLAKPIEETY